MYGLQKTGYFLSSAFLFLWAGTCAIGALVDAPTWLALFYFPEFNVAFGAGHIVVLVLSLRYKLVLNFLITND
jgi:hypothetical protein